MDIFIKKAYIHQFRPDDVDLHFSDKALLLSPKIDEYLRKKIEGVYSADAKTGLLDQDHSFLSSLTGDLLEDSIPFSNKWREIFIQSDKQKVNDLIFIHFDKEGQEHFAFLRISLRESLIHGGEEADKPLQVSQNNLPGFGAQPDEGFVLNLKSRKYHLLEKRIKVNGAFLSYLSQEFLEIETGLSTKKSIKEIEKTAEKIAQSFQEDDFKFQSKLKTSILKNIEQDNQLSPEQLANDLFDKNLTAKLTFLDQVKDKVPEPIRFDEIDPSKQIKKYENQKLSLSNGIELIVPNEVYQDAESVEFIQNEDGSYSILIKNIQDIQNK